MIDTKSLDYYEFLQISPNADFDTINRVYKFLAARFHPDNPGSGDPEKFFLLKTAYDVLSDPVRRAEYDMQYEKDASEKTPMSESVDFMDNAKGELNRRLAVLAVLYYQLLPAPHQALQARGPPARNRKADGVSPRLSGLHDLVSDPQGLHYQGR